MRWSKRIVAVSTSASPCPAASTTTGWRGTTACGLFGPLLRAGIAVFEYDRTMLHHKTMVVDGRWATIGTTNFDNRSFAFNEESNIAFTDPALVAELEETHHADEAVSTRLTLEAWQRRGMVQQGREFLASFLQDQV